MRPFITEDGVISDQAESSLALNKCALANPDLPLEFIKDLLISKHQDRKLAEPFTFEKATE